MSRSFAWMLALAGVLVACGGGGGTNDASTLDTLDAADVAADVAPDQADQTADLAADQLADVSPLPFVHAALTLFSISHVWPRRPVCSHLGTGRFQRLFPRCRASGSPSAPPTRRAARR